MVGSDVVIGWVKDSKGYLTVSNDKCKRVLHYTVCNTEVTIKFNFKRRRSNRVERTYMFDTFGY